MGYSESIFDCVLNHKEEGFLSKGSKIMELGAQEINTDVSVLKIIDFVKAFNDGNKEGEGKEVNTVFLMENYTKVLRPSSGNLRPKK